MNKTTICFACLVLLSCDDMVSSMNLDINSMPIDFDLGTSRGCVQVDISDNLVSFRCPMQETGYTRCPDKLPYRRESFEGRNDMVVIYCSSSVFPGDDSWMEDIGSNHIEGSSFDSGVDDDIIPPPPVHIEEWEWSYGDEGGDYYASSDGNSVYLEHNIVIKCQDEPRVYHYIDSKKWHFNNEVVFWNQGWEFTELVDIPCTLMSSIRETGSICNDRSILKTPESPDIYILDMFKLHQIVLGVPAFGCFDLEEESIYRYATQLTLDAFMIGDPWIGGAGCVESP